MSEDLLRKALQRGGACRLCMAPNNECVPIFATAAADKEPLFSKIQACVSIKVSPSDRMSASVCHACISYLNSWQSFKNRCDVAQKRHRGVLDQQIMRQRSLSIVGKAPSSAGAAAGSVMNQQQILNHAAQQQRRQEAIMHQRAQMRQQRILKEALTGGGGGGAGAQSAKRMPPPKLNSTAIDVSFIKDEPIDDDDVTEVPANISTASVNASANAVDAEDDEDIVDPMQFLANDVSYNDDQADDDDEVMDGDENGQPPILTSLGLTHINHNSDYDAYEGDADDSGYMLPPNAFRAGGGGGGGGSAQPKCTICNMKFSNRANARRHERNIHGKVSMGSDHGAAAAAAMLALSQNHQISITAPVRPVGSSTSSSGGQQQSLLLRNQPGMQAKRPSMAAVRPVFDYTQPKLYRELLTDAKLNFIKRHIEFLEQYQNMRCICCPRDFPTYKLFMAHMRKKYDTLSRNLCFKCLRQFETKSLFIGHLKKKNCINLYQVYCADDTISKEPLPVDVPASNILKAGTKEIIANKVYGCKLCDKTFRLKADFRSHVQIDHAEEQRRDGPDAAHGCAFCAIEFEDSAARKRHLNNLDCIVFLICGTCENRFETLAMYIEHVYADHLPQAAAAAAAAAASIIPVELKSPEVKQLQPKSDERARRSDAQGSRSDAANAQIIDTDTGEMLDSDAGGGANDAINSSGELDSSTRLRNPSHCLVCNKLYNNYYNMLRHMESKHPDQLPRTYRCEEGCSIGYPRQSELREHMFSVHGITLPKTKREYFTCRLCGTVFDQRDSWLDHQATEHERYYCNLCDMETEQRAALEAHLVSEHSTGDRGIGGGSSSLAASRANQCTICKHSFNSERGLETHLSVVHRLTRAQMPKRVVKEEEDGETDGGGGGGKRHMTVEDLEELEAERTAADGTLGNRADDEDDEEEPVQVARRPNPGPGTANAAKRFRPLNSGGADVTIYRKCRLCGETFAGNVALSNHMRTHGVMSSRPAGSSGATTSATHAMRLQGAMLANRSKVISRMRCRICQKRIHTKTSYKRHMLNIHGVRDCVFIKCTVCPAEFSNDKGLKVHMFRTHHITVQQMLQDHRLRPVPQKESTSTPNTPEAAAAAGGASRAPQPAGKEFECNFCHTVYRSRDLLHAHQTLVHGTTAAGAVQVKDEPQSEDDVEMIGDDDDEADTTANSSAAAVVAAKRASHLLSISDAAAAAGLDPGECWWQCRYCDETFNASKKLTIHMNSHSEHDTTDHTCADCGNVYGTRKSLWVHRHKKHPRHPNPSACELCEKVFFDKTELFHHLKTHSNTDVFSHLTEMQTQLAEADQQTKAAAAATGNAAGAESCHICGQRFHDKRVLSKHLRQHELNVITETGAPAEGAAASAKAATATTNQDDAAAGYIIPSYDGQMVDNEYACDMCPKTFPLMSALKVHRGWHFRSPDGRQVTDTANMWQPDRRASMGGKRYRPAGGAAGSSAAAAAAAAANSGFGTGGRAPTCPYCKSTFASGNNLRRHIVEVHKRNEARIIRENGTVSDKVQVERVLECSQCDIILADRGEWVEHKIGHARTMKPSTTFEWGCEICGKIFTRKERLLAHMVTHLGGMSADGSMTEEGGAGGAGDGGNSRSSMSSLSQQATGGGGGSSSSRLRAQLQKPLEHPGTADAEGGVLFGDDEEMEEGDEEEEEMNGDEDGEGVFEGEADEDEEDGEDDEGEVDDDVEDDDEEEITEVDTKPLVTGASANIVDDDDDDDDDDGVDDDEDVDDDGDVEDDEDEEEDATAAANGEAAKKAAAYSCDLCQVFFGTAKELRRHVASHIINEYPLSAAVKVKTAAGSPGGRSAGSTASGQLDGFRCRLCGSSSESHLDMIQCMDGHKVATQWRCDECKLYFGGVEERAEHTKLCHPKEMFED